MSSSRAWSATLRWLDGPNGEAPSKADESWRVKVRNPRTPRGGLYDKVMMELDLSGSVDVADTMSVAFYAEELGDGALADNTFVTVQPNDAGSGPRWNVAPGSVMTFEASVMPSCLRYSLILQDRLSTLRTHLKPHRFYHDRHTTRQSTPR